MWPSKRKKNTASVWRLCCCGAHKIFIRHKSDLQCIVSCMSCLWEDRKRFLSFSSKTTDRHLSRLKTTEKQSAGRHVACFILAAAVVMVVVVANEMVNHHISQASFCMQPLVAVVLFWLIINMPLQNKLAILNGTSGDRLLPFSVHSDHYNTDTAVSVHWCYCLWRCSNIDGHDWWRNQPDTNNGLCVCPTLTIEGTIITITTTTTTTINRSWIEHENCPFAVCGDVCCGDGGGGINKKKTARSKANIPTRIPFAPLHHPPPPGKHHHWLSFVRFVCLVFFYFTRSNDFIFV